MCQLLVLFIYNTVVIILSLDSSPLSYSSILFDPWARSIVDLLAHRTRSVRGPQSFIPQKLLELIVIATTKRALIFTHRFYFKTLQSHFAVSNRRNLLQAVKTNETKRLIIHSKEYSVMTLHLTHL